MIVIARHSALHLKSVRYACGVFLSLCQLTYQTVDFCGHVQGKSSAIRNTENKKRTTAVLGMDQIQNTICQELVVLATDTGFVKLSERSDACVELDKVVLPEHMSARLQQNIHEATHTFQRHPCMDLVYRDRELILDPLNLQFVSSDSSSTAHRSLSNLVAGS